MAEEEEKSRKYWDKIIGFDNLLYLQTKTFANTDALPFLPTGVYAPMLNSIILYPPGFKDFHDDERGVALISNILLHENLHKTLRAFKEIREKHREGEEVAVEALVNIATMGMGFFSFERRKRGRQRWGEKRRRKKNGR